VSTFSRFGDYRDRQQTQYMVTGKLQIANYSDNTYSPFYEQRQEAWWCERTFSSGLHAAGDVDRITKETVPRHRNSNHSADHRSTVQAAADHHLAIWTMRNLRASTSIDKNSTRNVKRYFYIDWCCLCSTTKQIRGDSGP